MKTTDPPKEKPGSVLRQEQYRGLLFCWRIRKGLRKELDLDRIKKYVDWFFRNNLEPHFEVEESFIFPLLKNKDQLLKKARADHRRLKRLFQDTTDLPKSLSLLEEELEAYFLFERQRLIYEIENDITEKELSIIMQIHTESLCHEDWGDEFWR